MAAATATSPSTPAHKIKSTSSSTSLPPPPLSQTSSTTTTTTNPSSSISLSEVQYITEGCASNLRIDGRTCDAYRPYTISTTSSTKGGNETLVLSNGSSRVLLPGGSTDILCSIRAELVKPAPSSPNQGIVELSVESSSSGAGGKRSTRAEELEISSILSKLLLPRLVDKSALVILPHKYVWRLFIDVLILSCDGSVLDVVAMSIVGAIKCTLLPKITPVFKGDAAGQDEAVAVTGGSGRGNRRRGDDFIIDGDITNAKPPPAVKGGGGCPVIVTVAVLTQSSSSLSEKRWKKRQILVIDTRAEEEACASSKITVSVDGMGNVCGVHKHGSGRGTLTMGVLGEITGVAVNCSKKVLGMMKEQQQKEEVLGEDGVVAAAGENMLRGHFELR